MLTAIKAHVSRLNQFLHDSKGGTLFVATMVAIVVVGGGLIALFALTKPVRSIPPTINMVKPTPKPAPKYYSALTGLEVDGQAAITTPVTAVMIENSPDARPQSGLKEAGVIFEAIAEGGITRFAAVFQGTKPALIGPVRSVRPYYISWLAPFQPGIAHVGGSALALATIRNGQYRDLDQFFNASTYWRSTDRYAPHNVYTSGANLDALNAAKSYTSSTFTGFVRSDPTLADANKPKGAAATSIDISISGPLYDPSYSYDAANKTYARTVDGAPTADREAGPVDPTVVIVMKVPTATVLEDGYREQMTVIGSGEADVFERGQVFIGTWSKAGQTDQLRFLDQAGKDIPLDAGQTWITAIPTDNAVHYK